MAHYAKVLDGKVISVIVADAEYMASFVDTSPGKWLQTSYNTRHNKHHKFTRDGSLKESDTEDGGTPLRGNYAGIGVNYDYDGDYFYHNRPNDDTGAICESWRFDTTDVRWKPPIGKDYPDDGKEYKWVEASTSWVEVT